MKWVKPMGLVAWSMHIESRLTPGESQIGGHRSLPLRAGRHGARTGRDRPTRGYWVSRIESRSQATLSATMLSSSLPGGSVANSTHSRPANPTEWSPSSTP